MAADPTHQFLIHKLVPVELAGYDISVTNQSAWMLGIIALMMVFFAVSVRKRAMVPGRLQAFAEITYEFIENLMKDTTGRDGLKYLPFIFTLFIFIAALNVSGMLPGSFTSTSQIVITSFMAFTIFAGVILIGLFKHGIKFLGMFLPAGTPIVMAPLMIVLEIISFFARPFTLALRLGANMMAGHIVIKLFASFIIMMLGAGAVVGTMFVLPLAGLFALTALELFVAFLQAYIFTLLACVYLNDALHLH